MFRKCADSIHFIQTRNPYFGPLLEVLLCRDLKPLLIIVGLFRLLFVICGPVLRAYVDFNIHAPTYHCLSTLLFQTSLIYLFLSQVLFFSTPLNVFVVKCSMISPFNNSIDSWRDCCVVSIAQVWPTDVLFWKIQNVLLTTHRIEWSFTFFPLYSQCFVENTKKHDQSFCLVSFSMKNEVEHDFSFILLHRASEIFSKERHWPSSSVKHIIERRYIFLSSNFDWTGLWLISVYSIHWILYALEDEHWSECADFRELDCALDGRDWIEIN